MFLWSCKYCPLQSLSSFLWSFLFLHHFVFLEFTVASLPPVGVNSFPCIYSFFTQSIKSVFFFPFKSGFDKFFLSKELHSKNVTLFSLDSLCRNCSTQLLQRAQSWAICTWMGMAVCQYKVAGRIWSLGWSLPSPVLIGKIYQILMCVIFNFPTALVLEPSTLCWPYSEFSLCLAPLASWKFPPLPSGLGPLISWVSASSSFCFIPLLSGRMFSINFLKKRECMGGKFSEPSYVWKCLYVSPYVCW